MIDQALLTEIQSALVEPRDGGAAWPSGLWTRDEVIDALNMRQIMLFKQSLCTVQAANGIAVGLGVRRIDLPADCVRLLSVTWRGADGEVRGLFPSDSFEADHGLLLWESTNASYPLAYSEYDAPMLQVELIPGANVPGVLDLLYIPTGAELTGNGVALTAPDVLGHAIKYGALADLLSKDGRGRDLGRAQYAEERFNLAVNAARWILEGWS